LNITFKLGQEPIFEVTDIGNKDNDNIKILTDAYLEILKSISKNAALGDLGI